MSSASASGCASRARTWSGWPRGGEPGTLRALIHKGGLRADVLSDGEIRVGDPIAAGRADEPPRAGLDRAEVGRSLRNGGFRRRGNSEEA